MSELGNFLKELRGKKPLRAIGDKTGLSHSYISDLERGFRRGTKKPIHPSPDTLKRLSEAYDYSYEDLMRRAGYIDNTSSNKADIVRESSNESLYFFDQENLTPEELEALKEHLEFLRYQAAKKNKKSE